MIENGPPAAAASASRRSVGIGLVLLAALLFGLTPNTAKIAYQEGANIVAVIMVRGVLGALGLAVYLSVTRLWPANVWRSFRNSGFTGIAQALTSLGFIGSIAYIDVSLAALIFYLHILLLAVVGHVRGETRLTPAMVALIGTALAGLALVLGVTFRSLDPLGLGLSVVGMAAATFLVLLVVEQGRVIGPVAANFNMTLWVAFYFTAAALLGPATGLWDGAIFPATAKGWIGIVGNSLTTTLAFLLFFLGARIIGTTRAAMISLIEPVLVILLAVLLVQEWLTPLQWAGVAVVIGSLILFEIAGRKAVENA